MKKKLIFAAILPVMFFSQSMAQPNNQHSLPCLQPDTAYIYLNDGSVGGFYHYIYSNQGQRTEEHYFESQSGEWKESIRRYYTYGSDGLLRNDLQQNMDNGQWKNLFENSYSYDGQKRLTMEHYKEWSDSLGRWYNKNCFYYTYNQDGKVDTFFRIEDDSNYIARIFYHYDAQGNQTLEQWQHWDTAWTDMFRATSVYNSKNQLVDYLEENWNHTHGGPPKLEWENWRHFVYKYDSLGDKKEWHTWCWDCANECWINEFQHYYTYDSTHRCINELIMTWDRGNLVWVKKEFFSFEYDGNNRIILQTKQTPYGEEWINNEREAYVYDEAGRTTSKSSAYWNLDYQEWINTFWEVWDFDAYGNMLENTFYNWDAKKNDWTGVYRTLNSFDENGNGDTSRHEMFDNKKGWYPFPNFLSITYNQKQDTIGEFHTSKVSVHYHLYQIDSTPVASIAIPKLNCFPNPVKELLFVNTEDNMQIERYQLWNAQGQLLMDKQLGQNRIAIPMKQLPKGLYLLRCQTAKGTLVQTIIKQ